MPETFLVLVPPVFIKLNNESSNIVRGSVGTKTRNGSSTPGLLYGNAESGCVLMPHQHSVVDPKLRTGEMSYCHRPIRLNGFGGSDCKRDSSDALVLKEANAQSDQPCLFRHAVVNLKILLLLGSRVNS